MISKEDKEDLKFILIKMYPGVEDFERHDPTAQTLEIYLQALISNLFCSRAITELATGLVAGPAGRLYTGRNKAAIRYILKKVRDNFDGNSINFYICNQVIRLKIRTNLTLSLEGNPGASF